MNAQAHFHNIQSTIQQQLMRANKSIHVSVAWMTDTVLFDCLCQQAKNNIEVAIIIYDDAINERLHFSDLENYGGRIYKVAQNLMHNKFCIIDGETLITGSYNWTYSAAKEADSGQREENIIIIEGDAALAHDYTKQFKKIIQKYFGETYRPNAKAFDQSKVLKRLNIIKQLLDLEDIEDISKHINKIKVYALPDTILQIIDQINNGQYDTATANIIKYQQKAVAVTVYNDPEIEQLKIQIQVIEIELAAIANEIEEAEKLIHDFGIQHNRELGDLVRKILLLRKEKLGREAEEAKKEDNESAYEQKQQAYEEAEEDYANYSKEYQATKEKKYQKLAPEQQKELKKLHRKAVMKCHPDKVSESMKTQAEAVFNRLQKAYEENNLEAVRTINQQLENGIAFVSTMDELLQTDSDNLTNLSEKLNSLLQRLSQRKKELITQLKQIQQHQTYQTIQDIADWNEYFEKTKKQLKKELDTLTQENTITHE